MKRRIFFILEGDNRYVPIGGVKQVYRHVDALNQLGYDAAIILDDVSLKCLWFRNETRVVNRNETVLGSNDILVLSEGMIGVPQLNGIEKCQLVVYSQNPYMLFIKGFGGLNNVFKFYKDIKHVMCSSEHSRRHLSELLPSKIHRIVYSFQKPFEFSPNKDKLIAYMPRRRSEDIERVLAMLNGMELLKGWKIEAITDKDEQGTSDILKRASIFMAGGFMEGFGMPVSEGMLCGCVVVGWHGYGGEELFKPEFSFSVPDNDILEYTRVMRKVLAMSREERLALGEKASKFIQENYSVEAESKSIAAAWKQIIRYPMADVAAQMVTNNEGPYLEAILKWVSPRVGRIYVAESPMTFLGTRTKESRTKAIVDSVRSQGFDNIEYMEPEIVSTSKPMKNDGLIRNKVMERIQKDGFRWAWVIDADEIYDDDAADRLWDFVDEVRTNHPPVRGFGCTWYTYWRSIHYRVFPQEPFIPDIIVRSDARYDNSRVIEDRKDMIFVPPQICVLRHYSWAKPPSDIHRKIETWGHCKEVKKNWFENVFMKWLPGSNMMGLHPTSPGDYMGTVKCNLPVPKALKDHPYVGKELIEDEKPILKWKYRVKVVILNHNKPENSDKLYEQLAPVFDDVEIWDSGSDSDKIPIHLNKSFPNIYWTGSWNEIMRTCSDYDAVWMPGCDLTLKSSPEEYRRMLEDSLPFGCWSPAIEGRAHPFMQAKNYESGRREKVRNIEGMALAISGKLMKKVQKLVEGSPIGFGQDFWLCHRARKVKLPNYIDGRVVVFHPKKIGYNEEEAHLQMEQVFSCLFGKDFRRTVFEYEETYKGNLMSEEAEVIEPEIVPKSRSKPFTIVTVDNGWGYPEFVRATTELAGVRKIVMAKGVSELAPVMGIEIVKYDESLSQLIAEADVALFPKVGATNKADYLKLLEAGIPTVVNVAYQQGAIRHMENGFIYQDVSWATSWLKTLMNDIELRNKVRNEPKKGVKPSMISVEEVEKVCPPCAERMKKMNLSAVSPELVKPVQDSPLVSVITPTYHRNLDVVRRCLDCMKLQSMPLWEQLVCSDGEKEPCIETLIQGIGDSRIQYHFTEGKKPGDFGNTVRSEMLKKARGKYVLFFDDDNLILPDYLQDMTSALEGTANDFAICMVMHFGPLNEAEVGKPPKVLLGNPVKLYHVDPLQVLVKREVMVKVGWDTEVGYLSDGITLEKLGKDYKHVRVEKVLGVHL